MNIAPRRGSRLLLGLLPGLGGDYFSQTVSLMQTDCGHFQNFWVKLRFEKESPCVFTRGLDLMPLPVRHGEVCGRSRRSPVRVPAGGAGSVLPGRDPFS